MLSAHFDPSRGALGVALGVAVLLSASAPARCEWHDPYQDGWRDGYQSGFRDGVRHRNAYHRPYYWSGYSSGYGCRPAGYRCPPGTVAVPYSSSSRGSYYSGYPAYRDNPGYQPYVDPAYGAPAPYSPPALPSGVPSYYQQPGDYQQPVY